jgi:hypothetical protein
MNGHLLEWIKIAAIIIPVAGAAYVVWDDVGEMNEALAAYGVTQRDNRERIIVLETDRQAIRESLSRIEQSITEIHNSLKTRR